MDGNLWQDSAAERVESHALDGPVTVDLAIIGGGFTGCSAALEAARQGASVCLLEAERVGHGGSGRNVGLVNAGLWLPPDDIIAALGEAAGTRLIEALGAGPQAVFDLIARHRIACEATREGTLHCAHSAAGLKDLENRFRQGNRHGAPLQLLDAAETARRTGSAAFHGALFDPRAGTVQPLSYARGLARAAAEAGAQIVEQAPVTAIDHRDGAWRLTARRHHVTAEALLIATNAYHIGPDTPFRPEFVPVSYSQFATAPLPQELRAKILARGEGAWDTALVMSSFRLDAAGRLIVGGMGNLEGPAGRLHANWARRKLKALYPELAEQPFVHSWRGVIAMTSDHIPKIVDLGHRGLAIFGYSGRGIAPGTVFGTAAAQALITGDRAALPLAPVPGHRESLTRLRGAWLEAGATVAHATGLPI